MKLIGLIALFLIYSCSVTTYISDKVKKDMNVLYEKTQRERERLQRELSYVKEDYERAYERTSPAHKERLRNALNASVGSDFRIILSMLVDYVSATDPNGSRKELLVRRLGGENVCSLCKLNSIQTKDEGDRTVDRDQFQECLLSVENDNWQASWDFSIDMALSTWASNEEEIENTIAKLDDLQRSCSSL